MAVLVSRKYPLQYAGRTVHFPIIGNATFAEDGTLTIEDDQVKEFLVATEPSFDFKVKGKVTKKDKEEDKYKETEEMLESLELAELVELSKDTKIAIPPAKMQNWTDERIRKEILKKMFPKE